MKFRRDKHFRDLCIVFTKSKGGSLLFPSLTNLELFIEVNTQHLASEDKCRRQDGGDVDNKEERNQSDGPRLLNIIDPVPIVAADNRY